MPIDFIPDQASEKVDFAPLDFQPAADDSYEQQLADLGLTAAEVEQAQKEAEGVWSQRGGKKVWFPTKEDASADLEKRIDNARIAGLEVEHGPLVNLPRADMIRGPFPGQRPPAAAQAAAGAYNALAAVPEFFTTPLGVATLASGGLPATAQRLIAAGFAVDLARHTPEQIVALDAAVKSGEPLAISQAAASLGMNVAFAAGSARAALKRPQPTGLEPPAKPLPDPNTVAVNLAAPGTLRPTEQRALAPPAPERPADLVEFQRVPLRNAAGEVVNVKARPIIKSIDFVEEPRLTMPERGAVRAEPAGGQLPERPKGFQRTAEDVLASRAESEVARAVPPVAQSRPPETITAPDARVGAESPDGRGLQTTERIAVEGTEVPHPARQQAEAGRISAARLEALRPPDILDFIQDSIGPIKRHTAVPQNSQSLYDSEAYRTLLGRRRLADKLFSRNGTKADVVAQAAFDANLIKEPTADALFEKMEMDAGRRAEFYRTRGGREAQILREQSRQADNFVSAQKPGIRRESIQAGELNQGQKFKLKGEDFEVTDVKFNPDTLDAESVTVKDGPKFGEQTMPADSALFIDKKSLRTPKTGSAWLPEEKPGIISGSKVEAWADRTIAESKGRVSTGIDPELMAAYLAKGVAHMERGVRSFADWSRRMIAEYGDLIRPHLRTLFEQSQRTLGQLQSDGIRMRAVSRRGTAAASVPQAAQERLSTDPASFYARQRVATVEDAVATMSNAELAMPLDLSKQGNAQTFVARQLELSRRLMAVPETFEPGYQLFQKLAETGTSMGQLLNQFKLLQNATPDALVRLVSRRLADTKAAPLTPEQRLHVRVLGGRNIKDISALRAAEETWARQPTRENFQNVVEAQTMAEESGRLFNERVQRLVPRGFWDTLTAMSLGNKLSMLSQERNVVANAMFAPFRAAAKLPAAVIDMIDSAIRQRPRDLVLTPEDTLASWGAGFRALKSSARILGKGDIAHGLGKGESHINLRPLVAMREIIAGELLRDGKLSTKAALLAEASPPAAFAAGSLRALNAMDVPFREAARARLIAEALRMQEKADTARVRQLQRLPTRTPEQEAELNTLRNRPPVTRELVAQATRVPSLFLKPETLNRVNRESLGSVFQDPNAFTRWVLSGERLLPAPGRFLVRNVLPFISLPVNWAGKLLGWSPAGFVTHVARHAIRGDARAAKLAAGEAIIGSLLWTGAQYLYSKGIISPPLDSSDEQQKMRLMAGDIMPPNHVNVSALERLLKGEDTAWRPGDVTRDFTYYGSVAGAQMQMVAYALRQMEMDPAPDSKADWWGNFMQQAAQGAGAYLVNQTFMQGTRDLLDAFKSDEKMEGWLARYSASLLDTALPRQLEPLNRAVRDYQREIKDDDLDKRLHNVLVERLGLFTAADEDLPLKRDIWGRPLRQTPEGANPWLYQLFDVGKSRQIPDDAVKLEIYNLARRTGDNRAIPTPPDKTLTVAGQDYKLTEAQKSRLQELVGQAREKAAQSIVTPGFLSATDEQKLQLLEMVWALGNQVGQFQFVAETFPELEQKPKPAGFKPE